MDPTSGNGVGDGVGARVVDAGRGLAWWTEAWALFAKSAVLWIALALILFIIMCVLGVIPLLGALAASLLVPVFMGSWMLAARKVETGGTLEIGDLFTCFKGDKLTPLLVLGALLLAAVFVIGLVAGVLGAGALFGMAAGGANQSLGGIFAAVGASLVAVLVVLAVSLLLGMAFWFAPALVVFRGTQPVEALRNSFAASLKNFLPFLIYSVIYFILSIVATIPFGLGWIVLVPVLMISLYVSYRDIYGG
jgi:uncharacterized membrane protein